MTNVIEAGSAIGVVISLILRHEVEVFRISLRHRQRVGHAVRVTMIVTLTNADLQSAVPGIARALDRVNLGKPRIRSHRWRLIQVRIVEIPGNEEMAAARQHAVHRQRK